VILYPSLSREVVPRQREGPAAVRIEPWGEGDLHLLQKLLGDPRMMEHLGGPESPQKIADRQTRYERMTVDKGRVFKIIMEPEGEAVGWVGYWVKTWRGETIYEVGWSVLPGHQGRGIASKGTALAIAEARSDGKYRSMHAFPSVDNAPSNSICRKLGFTLVEGCRFEYPPGHFMECNDWRFDHLAGKQAAE
jgi:RimJ/RimL family protein N-acetyltransferase